MRLPLIAAMCLMAAPAIPQEPTLETDLQDALARIEISRQKIWENGAPIRERTEQVEARLKETCDRLFLSKPDETILNPLCYEVFRNHGLPG